MHLRALRLEDFRSYAKAELAFGGDGCHLFLGPNGSGKTNLLEAVGLLSLTRSFRGREDDDLVRWGQPFFRVVGEAQGDDGERVTIEVTSVLEPRRKKAFFRNDVRTPLASIVGILPTVAFLPQDLELFSGPPAERRRFLDALLSQVSPEYIVLLGEYQKLLQQRNALLRRIVQGEQPRDALFLWDRQIAARGSRISLARLELIETLNCTIASELESLGESWPDALLRYERRTAAREQAALEQEMTMLLTQSQERDLILQATTVGPHREDWQMLLRDRPLPAFASRGQERTAVLALLFLEVSYLELRRGERPVILLDDVFSELDDAHQERLMQTLRQNQVFLTATRLPPDPAGIQAWDIALGHAKQRRGVAA